MQCAVFRGKALDIGPSFVLRKGPDLRPSTVHWEALDVRPSFVPREVPDLRPSSVFGEALDIRRQLCD